MISSRTIPFVVAGEAHAPRASTGAWHAAPASEALAAFEVTADGLSTADAAARLSAVGPNEPPSAAPASAWRILVGQLRSVVVFLLVGACVVAIFTSDAADAVAIGAVLALNVALGFTVEIRANRAVEALSRLQPRRATAIRDGVPVDIDARDLVPGDIVLLDEGQAVAADARLLDATELRLVEAALTGESLPLSKDSALVLEPDTTLSERRNMVYTGTTIAAGTGRAIVVATGSATELGRIGQLVSATPVGETPLEKRLDTLGGQLVWVALLVGAVSGVMAWQHGVGMGQMLQVAIALAVAAVPEGLPTVATITLALGVRRMAKRGAIVRRLPSVETLGSVTVLCTDKTGTLTAGAMNVTAIETASHAYAITGDGYEPRGAFYRDSRVIDPAADDDLMLALRIGMMASRADVVLREAMWTARGDPTEAALAAVARKAGLDKAAVAREEREVSEVPFTSERKLMATFHHIPNPTSQIAQPNDGGLLAYVKGSPQRVLELCDRVRDGGTDRLLDDHTRAQWQQRNHEMSGRGLRVLAVACGRVTRPDEGALHGLTIVALIGMTDPPAAGVPEAIRAFQAAGVRTVMITGDQSETARSIARELSLAHADMAMDGRQIDALSDEELEARIASVGVFSRVSPTAKLRIVSAFQRSGEVVAMIGDGVNDAAALKKADVGVTMGRRGTDVARETAAVVLQDDRFETIGVAIREGRVVYDNIRKFVFFLFSCNLAEVFVLLGAGISSTGIPLAPIQILWLNLVTDTVPALALALEPAEMDVMTRPPQSPTAGLLSSAFFREIAGYAALIAISVFVCISWSRLVGIPTERALTMNFMALALTQLFHLGNARSTGPVVTPTSALSNPAALGAVALVVVLQASTILVPHMSRLLHVVRLTPVDWLVVLTVSAVPALVGQVVKARRRSTGAHTS
jgi:Ca2+-transporting ATPase